MAPRADDVFRFEFLADPDVWEILQSVPKSKRGYFANECIRAIRSSGTVEARLEKLEQAVFGPESIGACKNTAPIKFHRVWCGIHRPDDETPIPAYLKGHLCEGKDCDLEAEYSTKI